MNRTIYNQNKPHVNIGTIGFSEINGVPYEELGQSDFEHMITMQSDAEREYNSGKFVCK